MEDEKDTYLRFGGAALASMLHLKYDKLKSVKFDDKHTLQISEEITILQRINSYTKEHIPNTEIMDICIFLVQRCWNS